MNTYAYVGGNPANRIDPLGLQAESTSPYPIPVPGWPTIIPWDFDAPYWPGSMANTWDTGSAKTPAPYTHAEEREARNYVPDPFGDDCDRLRWAIKVLRAQIEWRKMDLNPASTTYFPHKAHIAILQKTLDALEARYARICGGECP